MSHQLTSREKDVLAQIANGQKTKTSYEHLTLASSPFKITSATFFGNRVLVILLH